MTNIDDQLATAARIISESSYLIALVGAGMSKESGIPTFRGGDGLWDKHGEPPMDGYQRMLADPAAWWAERQAQRQSQAGDELTRAIEEAKPNPGHIALAELERAGALRSIVTQNIDGLHQDAGSRSVVEIHGSRYKLRCVDCGIRTPREELFMAQAPPPCESCGGRVKFDSVLFGEPIPPEALEASMAAANQADCVLVIGTSATVRPAGGLPRIAQSNGA